MGKNLHLAVRSETQDRQQGFNVKGALMSILVPCMTTQKVKLHLMTLWINDIESCLGTVKKWPGLMFVFKAVFCVASGSVRQPNNLYFEVKKTKQLIQALTILTHPLE